MANLSPHAKLPPTLIIGLGGTGCDIVSRVDKLSNDEQRKYLRFVYFDTDANELRVRQREAPYTYVVQTSKRSTVGQALRTDREAREITFPTNQQLKNKPLTEGAGQIRAVSKLAFDSCLREGRITPLHEAIHSLQKLNGDSLMQVMRVFIVSTLVGGTGSGILLPVSLYLRDYLKNVCRKNPVIRGFCVLPDVFFHGENKTEVEKNNLRANAYATLRELDAFMLKADSSEAEELSRKFTLKMPTPGTTDDYDEYSANPLDFCFLFDGQNMDGDGLSNLEMYKEHAADCIFAASVSMLNKRLNSSEDNTILERCEENGRNRYCGLGTSKIVYPFAQIRDYIAMKWMQQSVSEDWLRYDKKYEEDQIRWLKSKKNGAIQKPIDPKSHYCESISSDMKQHNYFALSLYEACYNKDKMGVSFTQARWKAYYTKLKHHINDQVAEDTGYDEGLSMEIIAFIRQMGNRLGSSEKMIRDYSNAFNECSHKLEVYYGLTKRRAESRAAIVADSIFSPHNFNVSNEYHVEHWLTQNGSFIHPNAIRYFLYNLELMLKEELRRMDSLEDDDFQKQDEAQDEAADQEQETAEEIYEDVMTSSFVHLEKELYDFSEAPIYSITESKKSSMVKIDSAVSRLLPIMKNRDMETKAIIALMSRIQKACKDQYERVKSYYTMYLRRAIIQKALAYLNRLSDTYEFFFHLLGEEIKHLPRAISRIEENFANADGDPVKYVLASKACLEGMAERCPNPIDSAELTESFREELFKGIFGTISVDDEKKRKGIIEDLVSNRLLNYWRGEVTSQYGRVVDIDIFEAIRTQAEIEADITSENELRYYFDGVKEESLKLAAPFIDKPIGKEPYIIEAYAISTRTAEDEDTWKDRIIRELFPGYEEDPFMDKYQILFLKAMYNLKVGDLPKFAPADDLDVDPQGKGDYFKAYWKRINNILPDASKTVIVTPHLDRRWHYVGVMPDLSCENEKQCVREAQTAFFVSILFKWVKFDRDQYRFVEKNGKYIDSEVVVEDGRCNKLYEIYQAMLMSRPLVLYMLNRYAEEIATEKSVLSLGNRSRSNTKLCQKLEEIHLSEFDQIEKISVFELPILCKASGNTGFKDSEYMTMLANFLDFLEDYLKNFYDDLYVRDPEYVGLLSDQLKRMGDNLASAYGNIANKPFEETLTNEIINMVIGRMKSYSLCPEAQAAAQEAEDYLNKLKK